MSTQLSGKLFSDLEAKLPDLPRKQRVLARAILETPELIAFGSVRNLSDQLQMNNATIIRFAKSLGFTGYQELQTTVQDAYLTRSGLRARRAEANVSEIDAVLESFEQQIANLELARQHFLEADIGALVDALMEAERIVVVATGSAAVPAQMLVRLLRHIGLRGELASGSAMDQAIALHDVGPGDLVLAVGLWLTFEDTHRALKLARSRRARTVAIVGAPNSPLVRDSDMALFAPAQGASLTFSVVATIAVVEAVITATAQRMPERRQSVERTLHDLYLAEGLLAPSQGDEK